MTTNSETSAPAVKSPSKLAHIVLRTSKIQPMIEYYKTFLGATLVHDAGNLAFLTYDDEHHRIAFVEIPGTQKKVSTSCGLEHIAFSFDSLSDLLLAYAQRKQMGILPIWSVNHGPTTSMYYRDPDGNEIETQVENFDNPNDATAFMSTKEFAENPIGTDIEPEDMIARLKNGESEEALKKRVEMGPRGLPAHIL